MNENTITNASLTHLDNFYRFLGLKPFLNTYSPIVSESKECREAIFKFSDPYIKKLFGASIDRSNLIDVLKSDNPLDLRIRFRENFLSICFDNIHLENYSHLLAQITGKRFFPYFSKRRPDAKPVLVFYSADETEISDLEAKIKDKLNIDLPERKSRDIFWALVITEKDFEKIKRFAKTTNIKDVIPTVGLGQIDYVERQKKIAVISMLQQNTYPVATVDWSINHQSRYIPSFEETLQLLQALILNNQVKVLVLDNIFLYFEKAQRNQIVLSLCNLILNNKVIEEFSLKNEGLSSKEEVELFSPLVIALKCSKNKVNNIILNNAVDDDDNPLSLALSEVLRTPPTSPTSPHSAESLFFSPLSQGKNSNESNTANSFNGFPQLQPDSKVKSFKKQKTMHHEPKEITPKLPEDFLNYQKGFPVKHTPPSLMFHPPKLKNTSRSHTAKKNLAQPQRGPQELDQNTPYTKGA